MSAVQTRMYSPAQLLAMPDSSGIELVDGELVEKPVRALSAFVEVKVSSKLNFFCEASGTAVVLSATNGIQCFPDRPLKVRKPDVSVFKSERLTHEHLMEGFVTIAPDLAVEVISSHDEFIEITEKVEEYLAAGVALVWVIDPENEIILVHRKDGSMIKLRKSDELDGEDVLQGFRCSVAELFPQRLPSN